MASFTRMFVVGAAFLVCGCATESASRPADPGTAYFEKWADTTWVPMKGGTNSRKYNRWQVASGISLEKDSATIKLARGTYRVTGMSITTFGYGSGPVTPYESPGYAFLMQVPKDSIVILGSMQDPIYSVPSLIDGILTVTDSTSYIFAHQNGDSIPGIYLESGHKLDPRGGHLFARLVIQKLD
jgi:hypothetical protein